MLMDAGELALPIPNASERYLFIMTTQKPTDLKSVSLGQINDLEGKTVVGGGSDVQAQSSASKASRDVKKMEKTIEKVEKNPTPEGGSSTGSDSKAMKKDAEKRSGDGLPPYPPGL
jgi:hypothetical protein